MSDVEEVKPAENHPPVDGEAKEKIKIVFVRRKSIPHEVTISAAHVEENDRYEFNGTTYTVKEVDKTDPVFVAISFEEVEDKLVVFEATQITVTRGCERLKKKE